MWSGQMSSSVRPAVNVLFTGIWSSAGPVRVCPKQHLVSTVVRLSPSQPYSGYGTAALIPILARPFGKTEQVPVLINYSIGSQRFEKIPDERDLALLANLDREPTYPAPPIWTMPDGFNTEQPRRSHGYSHVHHFFTKRNLTLLTAFWQRVQELDTPEARFLGLFVLTGAIQRVCRTNRYRADHEKGGWPSIGNFVRQFF